jgi:hypothetical protein
MWLLWLAGLVLVVVGGVRAQRRWRLPGAAPAGGPALLERTLKDTRPDDVIQHDGRDYLVEGVVKYDEDGHTWVAARMVDGKEVAWLLVGLERDGGPTVRVLKPQPLELPGYPPETVDVAGTAYKLATRGTATATFTGDATGIPGSHDGAQRCRWWSYQAPGAKVLLVEKWGEDYRVLVGETARPDAVELLAAS